MHYHPARNKIELLAIHCRKGEELSAMIVKMGPGVITKAMDEFAFHTNLSWWIFALACLAALIIANITVSFQAIRAALTNPAEALRYE